MNKNEILKIENELKKETIKNEKYLNENYLINLNDLNINDNEIKKFLIHMKLLNKISNNSNYFNKLEKTNLLKFNNEKYNIKFIITNNKKIRLSIKYKEINKTYIFNDIYIFKLRNLLLFNEINKINELNNNIMLYFNSNKDLKEIYLKLLKLSIKYYNDYENKFNIENDKKLLENFYYIGY